jgi:hypothetical protein
MTRGSRPKRVEAKSGLKRVCWAGSKVVGLACGPPTADRPDLADWCLLGRKQGAEVGRPGVESGRGADELCQSRSWAKDVEME